MEGFLCYSAVVGEWMYRQIQTKRHLIYTAVVSNVFLHLSEIPPPPPSLGSMKSEHWIIKLFKYLIWLRWWRIYPNWKWHEHASTNRGTLDPSMRFSGSSRLYEFQALQSVGDTSNIATTNQLRMFPITAKCCRSRVRGKSWGRFNCASTVHIWLPRKFNSSGYVHLGPLSVRKMEVSTWHSSLLTYPDPEFILITVHC
jgi:hypothetical protein